MSSIVEQGYGVGDVISLLWFKRSLPRYCTQFIEVGSLSMKSFFLISTVEVLWKVLFSLAFLFLFFPISVKAHD